MRSRFSVVVRTLNVAQGRWAVWRDSNKGPQSAGDSVERSVQWLNTGFVLQMGWIWGLIHVLVTVWSCTGWSVLSSSVSSVRGVHWDTCLIRWPWAFNLKRMWVCRLMCTGCWHIVMLIITAISPPWRDCVLRVLCSLTVPRTWRPSGMFSFSWKGSQWTGAVGPVIFWKCKGGMV